MRGKLDNFKTGWVGLSIGIKNSEIDDLIHSLQALKQSRSHFHLRSSFDGSSGIADIEFFSLDENESDNLILDSSPAKF
jgi:hypothetical protein